MNGQDSVVSEVEFCLLGPVVVRCGGIAVKVPPGKQRVILAMLLLNYGRVVRLGELIEKLWVSGPPPSGPVAVQNYVMRLRKTLGDVGRERIITQSGGYLIRVQSDELDVSRFEALLAGARAAAQDGEWDRAATRAQRALELWRGEPLADVDCETLRTREAHRLAELQLQTLEVRIDADLHLGQHAGVIAELQQLAGTYPLRERLHGLLMMALYRDGRQAEALAVYQQARRVLVDELGTEPGAGLRQVHHQILTADPALQLPQTLRLAATGGEPVVPLLVLAAPAATPEVRYSLPPDAAAFTGRDEELGRVTAAVTTAADAGGVVTVRAIGGMPGAGKTALAVHAAHALRERFPGRQLFVDLHAHTPGREPVRPEDALAGLLAAVGVDPRFLPADLDGRAAMWRDQMAGNRALLVLDNAASSAQVGPLLPGGGHCLVLVTSRRHLGDLPGAVTPVLLDVLPADQAAEMFTRLAPRATADPAGVAEVVRLAGFLPLAVSLLARLFARHRSWTLADLATETRENLLTLTAENASIAAAFEVSYRHLDPSRQGFFRLLGLHPGATTDAYAAAALADTSVPEAACLLDGLHGEELVTETSHRRYGMHDLLRRYARDRAAGINAGESEQAVERLLDYYQYAAARADSFIARQARPGPASADATLPAAIPAIADLEGALAWARTERASMFACLDYATSTGRHARVVALTAALAGLMRSDGPFAEAITRHTAAIQAAQCLSDRLGQAGALADLGIVHSFTGDYKAATQALEQALDIYHDIGHRRGQADVLADLGVVHSFTGDYKAATQALEQALDIYHDVSDRRGQANALTTLGCMRWSTGDFPAATQALEHALDIYHDIGNPRGQAEALNYLGLVRRMTGDYPAAAQALEQALSIYRDIGSRRGQAYALSDLGVVRQLTGDYPAAIQALEQALSICHNTADQRGQGIALNYLGGVLRMTGDYPAAAKALEQALSICHSTGDRGGEAETLNAMGNLHRVSGELAQADGCHQQALQLAHDIASSWDEAHALAGLGRCALAVGHDTQAGDLLRQALEIFQRIGAAEAAELLAELDTLTGQPHEQ